MKQAMPKHGQAGASVVEMLEYVVVLQVLRFHEILSVDTILTDCYLMNGYLFQFNGFIQMLWLMSIEILIN